jgi:hypothetical protein
MHELRPLALEVLFVYVDAPILVDGAAAEPFR